ncbi:hypothetical protein fugu_015600 [Takifugu bimaculatus]|uniref:Uncharacterized protein n=1 Tax=Takifugu bimaculatus TaxID=433685 RepID=A0A4Z2BZA0_9TELE|nr:hypothetical protein fugu_015600 [Takifugu bimaculatus]
MARARRDRLAPFQGCGAARTRDPTNVNRSRCAEIVTDYQQPVRGSDPAQNHGAVKGAVALLGNDECVARKKAKKKRSEGARSCVPEQGLKQARGRAGK